MIPKIRFQAVFITFLVVALAPIPIPTTTAQSQDEAYEHNRLGMIAMSKAEFDEAIEKFREAARLVTDYQIRGRPLVYTPVFMTGWAYEKTGRDAEACEAYRRFLTIASPEALEETKAEHAREFISERCR